MDFKYPQISKAEDVLNNLVIAYNNEAILDKNLESQKRLILLKIESKSFQENWAKWRMKRKL